MYKLTATIIAALVFVSCSNDSVQDLPQACEGSGYYDTETHYCYQEVRQINADGGDCIITSAAEKGHTYEIICKGKHTGYLDNGKPGEKGENGLNGTSGEHCSIDSTKSGVEITCSTMTVPLHGAHGTDGTDGNNGIDGKNCKIASSTANGVEIDCGKVELLRHGTNGDDGEPGEDGTISGDNCKITPTDDDGVEITCDGVSLNGKKGDPGDTGVAGEDCTIKSIPSEGVEITCGTVTKLGHGKDGDDGSVKTIGADGYWYIDGVKTDIIAAGDKGEPGEGCEVKENGAYWVMTCKTGDTKTVEWPKAMCMMTAYDPAKNFCFENILAEFCDGKTYNLNNQICHYGKAKSFFTDERDKKKYVYVEIGGQTWMAENLNYATGGRCYGDNTGGDSQNRCDTYGRLYDWETANKVCPAGWHLPSDEEWDVLMTTVGGASTAGKKLKATSGWNSNGNGQDTYGFAALPGGIGFYGLFDEAGYFGNWWSSSEDGSANAYGSAMGNNYEYAYWGSDNRNNLYSVRCVKGDIIVPSCGGKDYNSATEFCDSRDNKIYKYVKINGQTWMAENLNYEPDGKCYDNNPANCETYGRIYDWFTAKDVCPAGWHLPSDAEWTALTDFYGGKYDAGEYLKAKNGWNDNGNGLDTDGFAALPGGGGHGGVGEAGNWWSSSEEDEDIAYFLYMYCLLDRAELEYDQKSASYNVRCLKN